MNKPYRTLILGMFFGLVCLSGHQTSDQHIHDPKQPHAMGHISIRDDVTLDLRIPYDTILYGEIPHIYVGIKNEGERPVRINTDFMFETWNQMLYEARGEDSTDNLTQPAKMPNWGDLEDRVKAEHIGFEALEQGESVIHARNGGNPTHQFSWNYDIIPKGTTQMRVSLLVGDNEWAFSDWVKVKRLDEHKLHELETIQTLKYGSIDWMVKQANIDGESYIFLFAGHVGHRIARIREGASPRFEVIGENLDRKLVIHFDGVDAPPVVHRISSIKTLEGSSETTPHLEVMRSLERAMDSSAAVSPVEAVAEVVEEVTTPEPAVEEEPAEVLAAEPTEEPAEKSSNWWLWLIGLLVVVGGVVAVRRKS